MTLNRPVYWNTLRWFLDSPARLVACGLMVLLSYVVLGGRSQIELNGVAHSGLFSSPGSLAQGGNIALGVLAWILGLGVIRREIKSGAIQLVLIRPLSRATYVLSKWAALATLNLGFLVFAYGVLFLRGGAAFSGDFLALFLAQAVQLLALAAVITFLSSVPFDLGELGLLLVGAVGLALLGRLAGDAATAPGMEWLRFLVAQGFRVLFPAVQVEGSAGFLGLLMNASGEVEALQSILFNACLAAAALAGACALLARREFTYAESGG